MNDRHKYIVISKTKQGRYFGYPTASAMDRNTFISFCAKIENLLDEIVVCSFKIKPK